MRIAARWQVERWDEVVLNQLSQSCHFLILLFHDLYVLCKLDDSLTIRLEPELRNYRQLNLCAQWEHDLLISDHAVTSLLLGMVNTTLMWRCFKC